MKTVFDSSVFGVSVERERVPALTYFEFASLAEGEAVLARIRRQATEAPARARAARQAIVPGHRIGLVRP